MILEPTILASTLDEIQRGSAAHDAEVKGILNTTRARLHVFDDELLNIANTASKVISDDDMAALNTSDQWILPV